MKNKTFKEIKIDMATKQINKLLDIYQRKLNQKNAEIKILLIDFTTEYNKIWKEVE